MSRIFWERRSISNQLQTFLQNAGWSGIRYEEGFGDPSKLTVIEPPQITIDVGSSTPLEMELGRSSGDLIFVRSVQFDLFAESEERVATLVEDIADFVDQTVITIKDASDSAIGSMVCYSTEDIAVATFAPIITPEIMRWRGAVQAVYVAQYS